MPELPEVETVRRRLAPAVTDALVVDAAILDARLTRPDDPTAVAAELTGERIVGLERRGKYLIVRFASGRALLAHLRMTGSFLLTSHADRPTAPHTRAVLRLDNGTDIVYRDVRRFGTWSLHEPGDADRQLEERLGPEPLGPLTAAALGERLDGRQAPLKAVLLDQKVLAGLGNIYVDEALWRAQLHPQRAAGELDRAETRGLHRAIRAVLRAAVDRQGSSLRDYVTPDGERGRMQDEFHAYGRSGEPCDRCGALLVRTVVAGRGTTFCPGCQRP